MRTAELQQRLISLGCNPGPVDGIYGTKTEEAVFDALDTYCPPDLAPPIEAAPPPSGEALIPPDWMPNAKAVRIVCHWTAGAHTANETDREHYHILIEGSGKLVRGDHTIADNDSTGDGDYAAHTASLNTGSIGVSLCAMAGATESPFSAGKYPITDAQWQILPQVVAELCAAYSIPVTRETVLSHGEVQPTLGVIQSGKWDYAWRPGMTDTGDPIVIGEEIRAAVQAKL